MDSATIAPFPLSQTPVIALGGAGFSNLTHPDPDAVPVHDIILHAFDCGVLAIDTSPFYDPSEQLLGQSLAHESVTGRYARADYMLMTKVGRIASHHWDYSPDWVRQSVERSLQRLRTHYLDVVFCHDIEAVTEDDVIDAVGVLLDFVQQGKIRYVGLSSYRIDLLVRRANLVRERFGRPIDVIQTWGQLNLQNSRLELEGLQSFRDAGVSCVFSSSPLVMGLLRRGGVPVGKTGEFHPAPEGLRRVARDVSDWVEAQGDSLAPLALRDALRRAHECTREWSIRVSVIFGVSSVAELDENLQAARKILQGDLANHTLNATQAQMDTVMVNTARVMLGGWVDWSFTCPPKGWSPKLKRFIDDGEDSDIAVKGSGNT